MPGVQERIGSLKALWPVRAEVMARLRDIEWVMNQAPRYGTLVVPSNITGAEATVEALATLRAAGPIAVRLHATRAYGVMTSPTPVVTLEMVNALGAVHASARGALHLYPVSGTTTVPGETSPTATLRSDLNRLRGIVAVQQIWRRDHRVRVHLPTGKAELQRYAAESSAGAAIAGALSGAAAALRRLDTRVIPRLGRELRGLVRDLRGDMRQADAQARTDYRARITRVTERIGEVVRWLRTEALPEIRQAVRVEAQVRENADTALATRAEAHAETNALAHAGLLAAVAPLVPWAGNPIRTATEKVRRTESLFDGLLNPGLAGLGLIAAFPALARLITEVTGRVAGQVPQVFGALEEQAARALDAID